VIAANSLRAAPFSHSFVIVLFSVCVRVQTRPVNVYRFITESTVEERLIARAEKKVSSGTPIQLGDGRRD
jgi:hypothetical protein